MGVSTKGGKPQKWMVYFMENPYFLMDDLGGKPHYFRKHPCMGADDFKRISGTFTQVYSC